jgi:hypothetical protein
MSDLSDDDEAIEVQVADLAEDQIAGVDDEEAEDDDDDDDDDAQEAVAMVVEDEDDNDVEEDAVEEVLEATAHDDNEDDDDDEDDTNDVQPQVVAMEVELEVAEPEVDVEAVAVEELPPPPKKASMPVPSRSTKPSRNRSPKMTTFAASVAAAPPPKKAVAKAKNQAVVVPEKKGKKRKPGGGKSPAEQASQLARVDPKRMNAANLARELLYETVPRLPFPLSDQYIVRNFGQLKVGNQSSRYSSKHALYPVGFSCDRYEFSPVHGRILKLRCAILDGKRIGVEGPVFRVMWGQGVDEDVDKVEYPYDPFSNSAPIIGRGSEDVVAVPAGAGYQPPVEQVVPTPGMRVRSRFSKEQYYHGTITSVKEKDGDKVSSSKGKKTTKKTVHLEIKYDDGSTEEAIFPDPDITLMMPGKCSPQA